MGVPDANGRWRAVQNVSSVVVQWETGERLFPGRYVVHDTGLSQIRSDSLKLQEATPSHHR